MRTYPKSFVALVAACSFSLSGCGPKTAPNAATESAEVDPHDHPHEGPHHGTLVELGDEEYHAEVVHDENSVTVYVLDASAKQAFAIDAKELIISVLHDGTPEQVKLLASPEETDVAGKSSRFTVTDADLVSHLDDVAAAPKLSLTIDGTAYRGEIMHDHDHDHDHEGHDHD